MAPLNDIRRVQELRDVLAFILFYSDKHIQAGLPIGSILGDTVRRLIVSLLRFPKVRNVIFLRDDKIKNEDNNRIFECIKTIFEKGEINDDLIRRGRIRQYDPKTLEFIKNIKSVKFKFYEFDNFEALRNMCESIKNEIYNNFELPPRSDVTYLPTSFKPLSYTIGAYSKPSKEDLFMIKVFDKVSDAYDYCVNVVKSFGLLYPNGNGFCRYQVKIPYVTITLEK